MCSSWVFFWYVSSMVLPPFLVDLALGLAAVFLTASGARVSSKELSASSSKEDSIMSISVAIILVVFGVVIVVV